MPALVTMLMDGTAWVARASAQAGVVVVVVLAAQWVFRRQLTPCWRYRLWWLVVLRLLMPVSLESEFSLFNAPRLLSVSGTEAGLAAVLEAHDGGLSTPAAAPERGSLGEGGERQRPGAAGVSDATVTRGRDVDPDQLGIDGSRSAGHARVRGRLLLSAVWLIGAVALAVRVLRHLFRLNAQLARHETAAAAAVFEVLDQAKRLMGIRRVLPVIQSRAVRSPALLGFIRPWLLLPEGMTARFSAEELRLIFLHELAHLKRRDIAMNWLMTGLQIVHWFNPLVWLAFSRMRADRELACDELALSRVPDGDRRLYGGAILKLLEDFTRPVVLPHLAGILEDGQQIKRRITMIAQFKSAPAWSLTALALMALLGCVSLTDSKRDEGKMTAGSKPAGGMAERDVRTDTSGQLTLRKVTPEKSETWDHWVSFGDTRPSPDGGHFAYVNWTHGNLAICDMRTGAVRDLTHDATWSGANRFTTRAIWSPDSRRIAYVWVSGKDAELRIVDRAGGDPRVLVPSEKGGNIVPFDWSRDGRHIVGLHEVGERQQGGTKKLRIVRVEVATGTVSVVKELSVPSDNVSISLSPDGRFIVHDTKPRGKDAATSPPSRLYIVRTDGSDDRLLIDHPAAHSSPNWTPDGGHLVFRSRRSGEDALWTVPMRDGAPSGELRLLRGDFAGSRSLGFADDGNYYFTASTPQRNVFVAEVDFEAGTMQAPRLVSLRNDGRNRNPRWSMDGARLAYVSSRSNDWPPHGALVFQEFATGKEQDVMVSALSFYAPPLWAPDLTKLAGFANVPGRGNNARALYVVDGKTGRRSMFIDRDASCPNYTRDGRHLIYLHHNWKGADTTRELIERDLASGMERVIVQSLQTLGFNDQVVLAHDETKLAHFHQPYSPTEKHKATLYITRRADGAMKPVWEAPQGEAAVFDWLPDHRRVLVSVSGDQDGQQLHLVDIETGIARPFGPGLRGNDKLQQVSVHPDGKRIACTRGGVAQEIWAMKNVAPEQVAAK